jgi:hypothetical protein
MPRADLLRTSLSFPQLGRKLSPSGNWLSRSHSNGFLPGCDCHGYYRTEENILVCVSYSANRTSEYLCSATGKGLCLRNYDRCTGPVTTPALRHQVPRLVIAGSPCDANHAASVDQALGSAKAFSRGYRRAHRTLLWPYWHLPP